MKVNNRFRFSKMISKLCIISVWIYIFIDIISDKKFTLLNVLEMIYISFGMVALSFISTYIFNDSIKKGK